MYFLVTILRIQYVIDPSQVIGHEITHGFDDQGRTFDSTGNLANWWERSTEENYLDKAQCIIWQYGNYTARPPVSINLNGINTQGENIADNGGIKEAYNAYQRCCFFLTMTPLGFSLIVES